MAKADLTYTQQIAQLSDYLFARRESILNQWRTRCSVDADLHTRTSFSREEFNDQMPVMLNLLAQRLAGQPDESDAVERAGQHGLHRWQRGYSLSELMNELANFIDILDEELHQFLEIYPQTQPGIIDQAHRQLLRLSKNINLVA